MKIIDMSKLSTTQTVFFKLWRSKNLPTCDHQLDWSQSLEVWRTHSKVPRLILEHNSLKYLKFSSREYCSLFWNFWHFKKMSSMLCGWKLKFSTGIKLLMLLSVDVCNFPKRLKRAHSVGRIELSLIISMIRVSVSET